MPTRQIAIAARENRRAHHGVVSALSALIREPLAGERGIAIQIDILRGLSRQLHEQGMEEPVGRVILNLHPGLRSHGNVRA